VKKELKIVKTRKKFDKFVTNVIVVWKNTKTVWSYWPLISSTSKIKRCCFIPNLQYSSTSITQPLYKWQ